MLGGLSQLGPERATAEFGDWTTRIAQGELPAEAPPRPQGIERNVVITQWDWADPKAYLHDEISTDKRNPSVNANGLIYGSPEESRDYLPVLDPGAQHHQPGEGSLPRSQHAGPAQAAAAVDVLGRRSHLGQPHDGSQSDVRSRRGASGTPSRIRASDNPAFCKAGSSLPSAKLTPVDRSGPPVGGVRSENQADLHDRHLLRHAPSAVRRGRQQHAVDQQRRRRRRGRLAQYEDVGPDARRSRNRRAGRRWCWTPTATASATPMQEVGAESGDGAERRESGHFGRSQRHRTDPTRTRGSTRLSMALAIGADGMIWGSVLGFPGGIVRLNPGSNPPETALAEYYEVPWNNPKAPVWGFSPRGMDIDRNGVAWVALGSGHLASFDRRKCKGPLNGPKATGQHCPEGWTLYPTPGPNFKNVKDSGSADSHYYDWVDQFDTLGLGKNTPIVTGNSSDSLHRSGERQVGDHARALSAGILRERDGRPHRRSRTPAGKARASGPPGARARRSTARPEKGPCPRWSTSKIRPNPLAN